MADRLSVFGIVIGIALLLTGIGFLVLVAGGAVRDPETVLRFLRSPQAAQRRTAARERRLSRRIVAEPAARAGS